MVLNFSENDSATRRAWKNMLFFQKVLQILRQKLCVGVPLLQKFKSIDYSL